jgi:ATP-dependent RNA helicase DeaD
MEQLFVEMASIIENEDLQAHREILESRMQEQGYSAMDVAAALLKLHPISKKLDSIEALPENTQKMAPKSTKAEPGMVRLFINIGKNQGVRPRDIVGAIAGESGLPGKMIGSISTYDKYTFVDVPKGHDREILRAMKNAKIRGKSVRMERASLRTA